MCKLMEDYIEKRVKEMVAEAARKAAKDTSINVAVELWNDGMRDMEKIAKLTKLTIDEVKNLFESNPA